ncbi:cytochrome P450 2C3-like [Styela clava]|uniref:cytochrome P450 2C3-like n=1 Tax=Styela clava TaxID=7725 RepID=UPI00193A606B|nr:cytochrome P450 2C3-like [Styela clava]
MFGVVVALLVVAVSFIYWYRRDVRLPQGPRGLPFFGIIPLLGTNPSKQLTDWAKVYGSVYTARFGQRDTVVLTDYEDIHNVHIKQAAKMGGRNPMHIFDVCNKGGGLIFATPKMAEMHRPFTLHAFRRLGMGSKTLEARVQEEAACLVDAFREKVGNPFDPKNLFLSAAVNISTLIMIGERYSYDDKMIKEIGWRLINEFLNEKITFYFLEFSEKKVEEHKNSYDENEMRDFIDIFLNEMSKENHDPSFNKRQLKLVLHDLLDAASQTTSCTLACCMIALVRYPECQERLRHEIKKVVGNEKSVSMENRKDMPYMQAFIHELMRRCTLVRLSATRTVLDGVEVRGYKLPKNTPMIAVTWAVHSDPRHFENPNEFRPERFINQVDGTFQKSKFWMPFATGKRNCLGEQLAQMELFIILATLIQRFEFSVKDETRIPSLDDGEHGIVFIPRDLDLIATERV